MNTDINKLIVKSKIITLINRARQEKDFNFSKEISYVIKKHEDSKEYVDQYFREIVKCIEKDSLDFIIALLQKRWYDLIKKHITDIVRMLQREQNEKVLPIFCEDYLNLSPDAEKVSNLNEILNFIENSAEDILRIAQRLRGYSEETDELLEEKMQKHSLD